MIHEKYQTTDTMNNQNIINEINKEKNIYCGLEFYDCRYMTTWTIIDIVIWETGKIAYLLQDKTGKYSHTNNQDLKYHFNHGQYLGKHLIELFN